MEFLFQYFQPAAGVSGIGEMEKTIEPFIFQRIRAKFQDKIEVVNSFIKKKIHNITVIYNGIEQVLKVAGTNDDVCQATKTLDEISNDNLNYLFKEEKKDKRVQWIFKDLSVIINHLEKETEELKAAGGKIEQQEPDIFIISCPMKQEVHVKLNVMWLCLKIVDAKSETNIPSDWSATGNTVTNTMTSMQSTNNKNVLRNSAKSVRNSSQLEKKKFQDSQKQKFHHARPLPSPKPPDGWSAHVSHQTSFKESINNNSSVKSTSLKSSPGLKSQANSNARSKPTQGFSDFKYVIDTNFGLTIRLYSNSIIYLKVDAIVNAANDMLHNIGGVALAIAKAAGPKLEEECTKITNKGRIPVSENCVTTGGHLPCQHVIHAVGPQWVGYQAKVRCLKDLYNTVWNILVTADKYKFKTIAMPAISSGEKNYHQ